MPQTIRRFALPGAGLFAAVVSAAAPLVPNAGFNESDNGRPRAWRPSSTAGAAWQVQGGRTGAAVSVTGDGIAENSWRSTPVRMEANRCYLFSFWMRGIGSGCVTSGPDGINVDWGAGDGTWIRREQVFRSLAFPDGFTAPVHLGQWHVGGSVAFDDVALIPVRPVCRTVDGLELGHGEQIDGNDYVFMTELGSIARNHARPLAAATAGFNSTRWCLSPDKYVLYRHELPARRWTKARLSVCCGYWAAGSADVEVSRDGTSWTRLATITNAVTEELDVPASLLPAASLSVRLCGSRPCSLQVYSYAFEGSFDGAPVAAVDGATAFIDETTGKTLCETLRSVFFDTGYGSLLPGGDSAVALWGASSGWKIPRRRALPTERTDALTVKTAANEAEAVQLIVTPQADLKDVRVEVSALVQTSGATLATGSVDILRVGYVPVRLPTDGMGRRALWPDPLPPQGGPLAVAAGENQPFWVRVKPPNGTPAGRYAGSLSVRAVATDGAVLTRTAPFAVEVFGFDLPDTMTCETGFGFNPGRVAQYHGLKTAEQRRSVTAKYLKALADHHLSPYNPTPHVSWKVSWKNAGCWTGGEIDCAVKFSGTASKRVVDASVKRNESLRYTEFVPYGPKGVKISFRYRTATDQPANFCVEHHRDVGWWSGHNHDYRLKPSRDWQTFETVHKDFLTEGVRSVGFSFYAAGWRDDGSTTGTLWVDDVVITDAATGRPLTNGGDFEKAVSLVDAQPVFQWDAWDRAMEEAFAKYHFNTFVMPVAGLGGGTYEARTEPSLLGIPATDPAYDVLMGRYLCGIEAHLKEKGWLDKAYVYWFDEPEPKDYTFVMKGFDTLRRHAPGLRRMLTEEATDALLGGPNLWVPLTPNLHVPGEAKARAAGDTFWWYVCCGPKAPYVTEFTDHPGTEMRLWLWQTWGERVTGVLIWETVWWTSADAYPDPRHPQNPYEDAMCWVQNGKRGVRSPWGNGDGRFLYPPVAAAQPAATPVLDGPVDSYRLEMLRDGLEDYEYFAMLKRRLAERTDLAPAERTRYEALLKVPSAVYTSLTEFATDPASMEAHREKLARAIEQLR